jgi:hypothetical protein
MSLPLATESGTAKTTVRDLGLPVTPDSSDQELLAAVVEYYAATLARTPAALEYLKARGIGAEAIEHFQVGYCDRTLCLKLPLRNRKAGTAIRERLAKLGILRESGHEHFRGSVTVPVFDEAGAIAQVFGRKVRDDLRKGTAMEVWLPGPHGDDPLPGVAAWKPSPVASSPEPPPSPPPSTPAPASPAPAPPPPPMQAPPPAPWSVPEQLDTDELVVTLGDRRYRARGLLKNTTFAVLKVNLLASRETPGGAAFHVDTFDLLVARQRQAFVKQAAVELGLKEEVVKKDVGTMLLRLEEEQERLIRRTLEPAPLVPKMTDAEAAEAMALLKSPDLAGNIVGDMQRCGLAGEATNALVAYLGVLSRKLDKPLAMLVRSSSGSGKSSLMDSVLSFLPEDDKLCFSALTAQALYYLGESNLQHRVLAVAEDQGTAKVAYPLKLLLSEGALTIGSTSKDDTGRLVSETYKVKGPVALLFSSTAADLDEELVNRCLVLTIDESREQTRAVHRLQQAGETLDGLLARRERERLQRLHQNAQRLLRPLTVLNPFAGRLTFPDVQTRMRRDFPKYLTLVKTIALLHQHQREVKKATINGELIEYVEVQPSDIRLANRLCHEVLGQSLDELPPQARRLLTLVDAMVAAECQRQAIERSAFRFGRRDIRRATGWSDFQVRTHLARLLAMELVVAHRGGRGQLFEYELLWDGKAEDGRFALGLIDPDSLGPASTTGESRGPGGQFEGPSCPHSGPIVGPSWAAQNDATQQDDAAKSRPGPIPAENARPGGPPFVPAAGRTPIAGEVR